MENKTIESTVNGEVYINGLEGKGYKVTKINGEEVFDKDEIYPLYLPGEIDITVTEFDEMADRWIMHFYGMHRMNMIDFEVYTEDGEKVPYGLSDTSGYYISVKDIYEKSHSLNFKIKVPIMRPSSPNEILVMRSGRVGILETPVLEIGIKQRANKISYLVGEYFDPTGMAIEGTHFTGYKSILTDYTVEHNEKLTQTDEKIQIQYQGCSTYHPIEVIGQAIYPTIQYYRRPKKWNSYGEWEEIESNKIQVARTEDAEYKTVLKMDTKKFNFTSKEIQLKLYIKACQKKDFFQQFYASNILTNVTDKTEILIYAGELLGVGQEIEIELAYYNADITFENQFAVYFREPRKFYSSGEQKPMPLFSRVNAKLDLKEGVTAVTIDDFLAEDTDSLFPISHCFKAGMEGSYYGKNFNLNLDERLELLNPTSKFCNPVYRNAFGEEETFSLAVFYYKNDEKVFLTSDMMKYLYFSGTKYFYEENEVTIEYRGTSKYYHYTDLPSFIKNSDSFKKLMELEPYTWRPSHWLGSNGVFKGYNLFGKLTVIMDCALNCIQIEYDEKNRVQYITKNERSYFAFHYNATTQLLKEIIFGSRKISYSYSVDGELEEINYYKNETYSHCIYLQYVDGYYQNEATRHIRLIGDSDSNQYEFSYQMDSKFIQRLSKIKPTNKEEFIQIEYEGNTTSIIDQDDQKTIYELTDLGKISYEYGIRNGKVCSSKRYIYDDRSDPRYHIIHFTATETDLNRYTLEEFKSNATYNGGNDYMVYYDNQYRISQMSRGNYTSNGSYIDIQLYTYADITHQLKEIYRVLTYKNDGDITFYITEETKLFYQEDNYTLKKKAVYYSEFTALEEKTALFVDVWDYIYDEHGNVTGTNYYRLAGAPIEAELKKENADKSYFLNKKDYYSTGLVSREYDIKNTNAIEYHYNANECTVCKTVYGNQVLNYTYDLQNRLTKLHTVDQADVLNQNTITYEQDLVQTMNHSNNIPIQMEYDEEKRIKTIKIDGMLIKRYDYNSELVEDNNTYYGVMSRDILQNRSILKIGKTIDQIQYYVNEKILMNCELDALGRISRSMDYITQKDTTINYHTNGNQESIIVKNMNGEIQNESTYSYDDKDRLVCETGYGRTLEYTYKNKVEDLIIDFKTDVFHVTYEHNIYGTMTQKTIYINDEPRLSLNLLYDEKKYNEITALPVSYRYTSPYHQQYDIEYDAYLNISTIKKDDIILQRFQYDTLNRLIREDQYELNQSYGYSYDGNGNLIRKIRQRYTLEDQLTPDNEDDDISYQYEKDLVVAYNGESIEYDKRRNISTLFGESIKYNERNMMSQYGTTLFIYDGAGLRIQKGNTRFYYDNEERLIKDNRGKSYYYDHQEIIGMSYKGEYYVYVKDPLGNIIGLLDSKDNYVVKYRYDAWGNHEVIDGNGNEITDKKHIGNLNPFRYKGYYYDEETGLYYLKSRYYSPKLGRFLQMDSIEYADPQSINGLNLYCYCYNNPISYADPSGNLPQWAMWLIGGVVIAGLAIATLATGGAAGGVAGFIFAGALKGAIAGAVSGALVNGTISGISSAIEGEGFWSGFFDGAAHGFMSGAVIGGITGAISSGVQVYNASKLWVNTGNKTAYKQMVEHYGKHVIREGQKSVAKNIVNYSKQASQFFVNNSSSGVVLRQGVIKIAGAPGGIFNIDGLIRSFWYI